MEEVFRSICNILLSCIDITEKRSAGSEYILRLLWRWRHPVVSDCSLLS
jgi:hypothetical protein